MHPFYLDNISFQCLFYQEKHIFLIRLRLPFTWAIISPEVPWCLTSSDSFQNSRFARLFCFPFLFYGGPLQIPIGALWVSEVSFHTFLLSPALLSHAEATASSVLLVSSIKCLPFAKVTLILLFFLPLPGSLLVGQILSIMMAPMMSLSPRPAWRWPLL